MATSLWLASQPLLLASRSAARLAMIEAAGIPVEVAAADIDLFVGSDELDTERIGDRPELADMLAEEIGGPGAGRHEGNQ